MATTETFDKITMFGASWCSDCRRSKALLDGLGVDYEYVDVEAELEGVVRAEAISGRKNIPVIVFPDQAFQVEPTDAELKGKLEELSAI